MRNRIPVSPSDIKENGRPGAISRLAFQIKASLQPQQKLHVAQKLLCAALGYRHLKEIQIVAATQAEPFPAPGSIKRADIIRVLCQGLHHKGGLSLELAEALAQTLDIEQLSVYQATVEALAANRPNTTAVMTDEFHSIALDPFMTPYTRPLIEAGAPAYTFAVRADGQAVLFDDLVEACKRLPKNLAEELSQKDQYKDLSDDAERVARFFKDELIPNCYKPVSELVRKDRRLPDGYSLTMLFNSKGEYRGRCIRADWAHGLFPSVRLGLGIYDDLELLLRGRIIQKYVAETSHEGNFNDRVVINGKVFTDVHSPIAKGVPAFTYRGDEQLFTFRYGRAPEWMHMAADEGRHSDIHADPDELRPLHDICLADERFGMTRSTPTDSKIIIVDGKLSDPTEDDLVLCGNTFIHQHQVLVRDQPWLRPDDIPAFVLTKEQVQEVLLPTRRAFRDGPMKMPISFDLVHESLLKLTEHIRTILTREEGHASQLFLSDESCLSVIAHTTSLCRSNELNRALMAHLESTLPATLSGINSTGYDSEDEYKQVRSRALLAFVTLGEKLTLARPELSWLEPAVIGMLVCRPYAKPCSDEVDEWEETSNRITHREQLTLIASRLILAACLITSNQPLSEMMAFANSTEQCVVLALLDGRIEPLGALQALKELHELKWKSSESLQLAASLRLNASRQLAKQRTAASEGFTAVGISMQEAGKPREEIQSAMRQLRKYKTALTTAQQTMPN